MKKYLVTYTEVYTGTLEVNSNNENEAIDFVRNLINKKELMPSEIYDGHEITVDFAEEVKHE